MDYEKKFSGRLSALRQRKDISARELSLSLGMNAGYINRIEQGKALPTMRIFFLICQNLEVTPMEFFSFEINQPAEIRRLNADLCHLNERQFADVTGIVADLSRLNRRHR